MTKSDHDEIKDLKTKIQGGGTGGNVTIIGGGTPTSVAVDGDTIGTQPTLNFTGGFQAVNDPSNKKIDLIPPSKISTFAGADDVGAGKGTGVGDSLSATSWTAVNLDRDYVLPGVAIGDQILFELDAIVTAGTGIVYLDVLSVNSGRYAGGDGGDSGTGWSSWQCPASTTTPRSVTARMNVTGDDIDLATGSVTFRLMYRLSTTGGSPLIAGNDTDGHFRFQCYDRGTVHVIPGRNTGEPPVEPPVGGTVTLLSNTQRSDASTATRTLASSSVTPAASTPVYAVAFGHINGINAATMTSGITSGSMTDTWGDSGGTSWTLISTASLAVAAPNAANSNFAFCFRRTVGTGPSAGTATFTRPVGTVAQDLVLVIFQEADVNEAPSSSSGPATTSASNVSSITQTLGTVGTNSTVIAWMWNVGNSGLPATPTLPTTGGTWTSIAASNFEGQSGYGLAVAYLVGGKPGNINWTGLLADTVTTPAGYFILDPSGSSTPAPGVETWDSATDTTANVNGDLTWIQYTGNY